MNIRGMAISYSSHKKQIEVEKENKFIKEIEKNKKEQIIDYELLTALLNLRKKKIEGNFIRSKTK
jgi:hypothetical protein